MLGAEIKNYLLEKSRVVGDTEKERNYHAFFFLLRGMSAERAQKYGCIKADGSRMDYGDFNYLKKLSDLSADDDVKEYNLLMDSNYLTLDVGRTI